MSQVENFLKGKTLSDKVAVQAVNSALTNAAPLKYNATKIDMAKGPVDFRFGEAHYGIIEGRRFGV